MTVQCLADDPSAALLLLPLLIPATLDSCVLLLLVAWGVVKLIFVCLCLLMMHGTDKTDATNTLLPHKVGENDICRSCIQRLQ